jgi:hypothetical protein
VVAKVREIISANKKRFNIKKFNEAEGKDQYHAEVTNKFAALGDSDAKVDTNSAWEKDYNEYRNFSQRKSKL